MRVLAVILFAVVLFAAYVGLESAAAITGQPHYAVSCQWEYGHNPGQSSHWQHICQ